MAAADEKAKSAEIAAVDKAKAADFETAKNAQAAQIILKADAIVDDKSELDCKKNAAITVTTSADVDVKKTAELMKRELKILNSNLRLLP